MTKRTYESLSHELQSVGFLSLNKALLFLKENYPSKAVSYPTALRLLEKGHLRAVRVGGAWRLEKHEILRFVEHGNWDPEQEVMLKAKLATEQALGVLQPKKNPKNLDEDGKPMEPTIEESFIETMRQRGQYDEI